MSGLFEVKADPSKVVWLDSDGVEHDGDFTDIESDTPSQQAETEGE